MLDRSFILLPGIGDKRERMLWRKGVHTWDDYRAADHLPGVARPKRKEHHALLDTLESAWRERRLDTLAQQMPPREHWRFHDALAPRIGYLDIETTGTHWGASTTVVGVHDGVTDHTHQLVRGQGLDEQSLRELLDRFDLLVTFHGAGFDLPVLRSEFPGAVSERPHLDLRTPLARLGYRGGLKRIEVDLGLQREEDVAGLRGHDAVHLWRRHERNGDLDALDTLLRYNAADCTQMVSLARFVACVLESRLCAYWEGEPRAIDWPSGAPAPLITPEVRELLEAEAPAPATTLARQATLDA